MTTTVSFDFDDTLAEEISLGWGGVGLLPIDQFLQILKEYYALGCRCIILTARTPTNHNKSEIIRFLRQHDVEHCISDMIFTSHEPKGPFALQHGVNLHYDDSVTHLRSVRDHGIAVVCSLEAGTYEAALDSQDLIEMANEVQNLMDVQRLLAQEGDLCAP